MNITKKIFCLYTGMDMSLFLGGTLGTWTEQNSTAVIKRYDDYFSLTYSYSIDRYSHGGLTSNFKIDLSNYRKMHMIINSSPNNVHPQYVSYTGNQGYSYTNNERNELGTWGKVTNSEEPKHYEIDISGINGYYYPGFWLKGGTGTYNIAAWWLE